MNENESIESKFWLDFLIDPSRLDSHLSSGNIPVASQLIVQFLHQAHIVLQDAKKDLLSGNSHFQNETEQSYGSIDSGSQKKIDALRLLTLKTAAFLKWDLDALEQAVPPALMDSLLCELLRVTLNDSNGQHAEDREGVHLFALQLYHRWCLRSFIHASLPARPQKNTPISVPGLSQPVINMPQENDEVLGKIKEAINDSVAVLEYLTANEGAVIRMPKFEAFSPLTDQPESLPHNWTHAIPISNDEFFCQAFFELTEYFFSQGEQLKALRALASCVGLMDSIPPGSLICNFSTDRLLGYRNALEAQQTSSELQQLRFAIGCPNSGIVSLLELDNTRKSLPMNARQDLELVCLSKGEQSLYIRVKFLNLLRLIFEEKASAFDIDSSLFAFLSHGSYTQESVALAKILTGHIVSAFSSHNLNERVKKILKSLVQNLISSSCFFDGLLHETNIRVHFSDAELQAIDITRNASSFPPDDSLLPRLSSSLDPNSQFDRYELERLLVTSHDPAVLRATLVKLRGHLTKQQLYTLHDKWKIPKDIQHQIDVMPLIPSGIENMYSFLLVGKARVCMQTGLFHLARKLLLACDTIVKEVSYKLSRLIRLQVLLVDLMDREENAVDLTDLNKRVKDTLRQSTKTDSDFSPTPELIGHCASFLLDQRDWDYLVSVSTVRNGYVQVSRQLAEICRILDDSARARVVARDFLNMVSNLLADKQKRAGASGSAGVYRELTGPLSRPQLAAFFLRLRETTVLNLIISCLVRLYCLLKDSISTEVFIEYANLWPASLASGKPAVDVNAVADLMNSVLEHGLSVDPTNTSWLKTRAGLCLAHSDYVGTMRAYLEMIQLAGGTHIDSSIVRAMIKCCSSLHLPLQAGLLTQLLPEPDYQQAFKFLQDWSQNLDPFDGIYSLIYRPVLLELLIYHHDQSGHADKQQRAVTALADLDLNPNNSDRTLHEVAKRRRTNLLRFLSQQFLR